MIHQPEFCVSTIDSSYTCVYNLTMRGETLRTENEKQVELPLRIVHTAMQQAKHLLSQ